MLTERENQLKDFDLWRKAVAVARVKLTEAEKARVNYKARPFSSDEEYNNLRRAANAAQSYLWELTTACSQGHNYLLWKLARDKR
jgi:hypothetical protein